MTALRFGHAVLAIYLEPAPYITALVRNLQQIWSGEFDVLFVSDSMTQNWNESVANVGAVLLPPGIPGALGEIRRRLATGKYRLVHLAGWGHPVLMGGLLLARAMRIPVAVESDTPDLESLCRSGAATARRAKRILKRYCYPHLFRLPAVFLPGGTLQSAYLRSYGVPESRIRVAQMTVDIDSIRSYRVQFGADQRQEVDRHYGIPENSVTFLYVGRLILRKGVVELINAFRCLVDGDVPVSLIIAGDGELEPFVRDASADCPRLYYLGRLFGSALFDAYCASDVFVLPSQFDPWGLVINEAMAASLPVITTDGVGCAPDLVHHGLTGLLVKKHSVDGLLDAMQALACDAGMRNRMAAAASDVIASWTIENQAQHTVRAWEQALA